MSALSLPRIQDVVRSFRALKLSTAGISNMMIRLSGILQPVYDEILEDVRQGARIWADETGWRVRGKLWWLWIFAHERSACIQSVAMTCQLRNISFHRFLKASLVHYIRTGKPMLLAEYEALVKSQVKAA
jgi:hypothetical protein